MKSNSVAICIPTFNQSEYLKEAIASALGQSHTCVEVYVIDDKSTDDTPEICKDFQKKNANFFYLRNDQNLGIAKNVNKLLRWPKTDFIIRLDSDDVLQSDYIKTLLSLFEKYPEAGVGHANVQQIDQYGRATRKRLLARDKEYISSDTALKECVFGYKVAANICMFKREVLEQVNFTQGRPEYTEDYDLWIRIADAGWGNVFSKKILASYRVWIDQNNYRVSIARKDAELTGYSRMFSESVEPAYERRGWNKRIIDKQRERFALNHAIVLKSPHFNKKEKDLLRRKVLEIYHSKKVVSRLDAYNKPHSIFARMLSIRGKVKQHVKDVIKAIFLQSQLLFKIK